MLRIILCTVGSLPQGAFRELGDNFLRSLKKYASIEIRSYKTSEALLEKAPSDAILLDEAGKLFSSREFSQVLKEYNDAGKTFTCILGGPDGFTQQEKSPFRKISLSPMTTTHDLAHLFLLEQLFRGLSIIHGSTYHRDEPL